MMYLVRGGATSGAGGPSAGLLLTGLLRGLLDLAALPTREQPPLPLRPLYPRAAQGAR